MKLKQLLTVCLVVAICLSMAIPASAASGKKATGFKDFDENAWYAEAVSAAVDNGLLIGKSADVLDPNGYLTRAEMATVINRAFGTYKTAEIGRFRDVSKDAWYHKEVQMAVQMGTYEGTSETTMSPEACITRQEIMTVVARALQLDLSQDKEAVLARFEDRDEVSDWALPYVRAMVQADYIHGRDTGLDPQDRITRAEFAQVFYNIICQYITEKGDYDKVLEGNILIRTDDVTLKDLTVKGDLILGNGVADGKVTLSNVRITGRLVVWGGGTEAVYCKDGTDVDALIVCRVDDAVKVIFDRESTLRVYDTIDVTITDRAKAFKETEVVFYNINDLLETRKDLNEIVNQNQIQITVSDHLRGLVEKVDVAAQIKNHSTTDTYKIDIKYNDKTIAETVELAPGKTADKIVLKEAMDFCNYDCTAVVTALRDGKTIGTLEIETTLHIAYLWAEEVAE